MRLHINWVSLIVRSKFTVFALFYFVVEANFPSTSPPRGGGAYIWKGDLTEGFFASLVWGAYTWRLIFGILRHFRTNFFNLIGEFTICLSDVPGVLQV